MSTHDEHGCCGGHHGSHQEGGGAHPRAPLAPSGERAVSGIATEHHGDCHGSHHGHHHGRHHGHSAHGRHAGESHCGHGHHHGHHHGFSHLTGRRLLWVSLLNFGFTLLEFVGGILSNSLSLISDAVHNLADAMAALLAYIAHRTGQRKPNAQKTFGYKRFEILAAFANAAILIGICAYLFIEAYERFVRPEAIESRTMLIVAMAGLLANLASVLILRRDKKSNLNVKAAYLHLLGDTLSSVAVIIGGVCIWIWGVTWLDPLITVLVGVYIIWHTWGVFRESANILMQGTPPGLDLDEVQRVLCSFAAVHEVHHLHAWRLNDTQIHLEGHVLLKEDLHVSQADRLRVQMEEVLSESFGISHVTIQIECASTGCTEGSMSTGCRP